MTNLFEKQLYACCEKESKEVFYASMVSVKGSQAEMRTSWKIGKSMTVFMIPVPEQWDGSEFTASMILDSCDVIETFVNRTGGHGSFQIRIASEEEWDAAHYALAARRREGELTIEIVEAGMVFDVRLHGQVGMESAARIKSSIDKIPTGRRFLLMDLTDTRFFNQSGLRMYVMTVKELLNQGWVIRTLVKKNSRAEELLKETSLCKMAPLFSKRENAVASLMFESLHGNE